MRRIGSAFQRLRSDERGIEAPAMIIVLPILFVLIIGLVDVGWMIKTRMVVDNIVSTAVKQAAADGGNYNPQTMISGQPSWSDVAMNQLWDGSSCKQSACDARPTVDCTLITRPNGTQYRSNVVIDAGDVITCSVNYPYRPISGALLRGPMGLGIGGMLDPFTLTSTARSEIGTSGY
jgi:Flp pilus assembly protein TadG